MPNNLKVAIIAAVFIFLAGCNKYVKPGVSVNDFRFTVFPYISLNEGNYFLVYQIDTTGHPRSFRWIVFNKILRDKAYYYFGGQVSTWEGGTLIREPLDRKKLAVLARENAIYWMNKDGSEVKLQIR